MAAKRLEPRERNFLIGGGAILAVAAVYLLAQGPLEALERSEAQLQAAKMNLAEAQRVHDEAEAQRLEGQALDGILSARGRSYDLGTAVYRALQAKGLTERATTETVPRTLEGASAVRIELEGVSMEELVDLLYDIHSSDELVVLHELRYLRPMPSGQGLTCVLVLLTPRNA